MADADPFITVLTFTYPHELAVVRARLESEDIECNVLNELTAQVAPYYSNAIGGILLQVKESDLPKTLELLKEWGLLKNTVEEKNDPLSGLNKFTASIPFLKRISLEKRLLVIAALIVGISIPAYVISLPSDTEKILNRKWCIDYMLFQGKPFPPETPTSTYRGWGACPLNIYFGRHNELSIPGCLPRSLNSKWEIREGGLLYIFETDTFKNVFDGTYTFELSDKELTLMGDRTIIRCYSSD